MMIDVPPSPLSPLPPLRPAPPSLIRAPDTDASTDDTGLRTRPGFHGDGDVDGRRPAPRPSKRLASSRSTTPLVPSASAHAV